MLIPDTLFSLPPADQVPLSVPLEKTFFVFNTGGLDMHLSWKLLRYQNELDCERPESKVIDVKFNIEELPEEDERIVEFDAEAVPSAAEIGEGVSQVAVESVLNEGLTTEATAGGMSGEPTEKVSSPRLPRVSIAYEAHAMEDDKPFVVEPAEKVR